MRMTGISIANAAECGIEEHSHSESCYEKRLICAMDEDVQGAANGQLRDDLEHGGPPEPEADRLDQKAQDFETKSDLNAEEAEADAEAEFLQTDEEGHRHDADCYEEVLICGKEEHTHSVDCYSDNTADTETEQDWKQMLPEKIPEAWNEALAAVADSQIGYVESIRNFKVDENGVRRGYTRYGEWYGNPYGEWNAMFVGFCIENAGIPKEAVPFVPGPYAWQTRLKEEELWQSASYTPGPGDILFIDADSDGRADRVGIVDRIDDEKEVILAIEGNIDQEVAIQEYPYHDTKILGYCGLGKTSVHTESAYELSADGEDYKVTVHFTEDAQIPKDAALSVTELSGEDYEDSCKEAMEVMGLEELSFARFFDVSFLSDGKEIEPSAPVSVEIQYQDRVEVEDDQISGAIHFAEEGTEILDAKAKQEEDSTTFSFTQNSFSVVGTAVGKAAAYAARPSTQSGYQTDTLEIGGWYILYAVYGSNGKGYAISAADPSKAIELDQATTSGGTVEYHGTADVLWEYTDKGFRNKDGQYLTLTYVPNYWQSTIGLSSGTGRAKVTYDAIYHVLYNTEVVTESSGATNVLRFNTVRGELWTPLFSGRSETSLGSPSVSYKEPDHYIAKVASGQGGGTTENYHPMGAMTGTPKQGEIVFYNIDASTSSNPVPLAGVAYTVYENNGGQKGRVVTSLQTIDSFALSLGNLTDGKNYIIEQTAVPKGYVVYPQTKYFRVENGSATVDVFYDYKVSEEGFFTDKTAQVVDYVNRTYKIDLSAASGKYGYNLENLNFSLVVDQSNSMLFPVELTYLRNTPPIYTEPTGYYWDETKWDWIHSEDRNNDMLNSLNLDKYQVYYAITDMENSATVWAIYYDHNQNGWCYQDAAYYAKAQFHTLGLEQNAYESINIKGTSTYTTVGFTQADNAYWNGSTPTYSLDGLPAVNGGGFRNNLGGSFGSELPAAGSPIALFTGSKYNRLHELQEGVGLLASLLGSLNANTTLELVTFAKYFNSCQTFTLNNNEIQNAINAVNNITTTGGTSQNLALDHVRTHDLKGDKSNYVILITDGAPAGGVTIDTVKYAAYLLRETGNGSGKPTLITVGLSMENVHGGSAMLKDIASTGKPPDGSSWNFAANHTGDLSNVLMEGIFKSVVKLHYEDTASVVRDTISNSFYLIDPDTKKPLADGTTINLNGQVDRRGPGIVRYDSINKEWYVEWIDQNLPSQKDGDGNPTGRKWTGSLYVKAKEDFIGGNAIDTNKSATIQLKDGGNTASQPLKLETPTVNVRLLGMQPYDAESTVFLGDPVERDGYDEAHRNGVPDVLDDFYARIDITKIVDSPPAANDQPEIYNKPDAEEADGCHEKSFTLPYAIGQLNDEQWRTLLAGDPVTVPYTYDDESSHGAVGEFTLRLRQWGVGHDGSWGYEPHEMHEVGHNVCKYYLDVTYTAYKLGDHDRPAANAHNSGKGPGTEVDPYQTANDQYGLYRGNGNYTVTHEYDVSVLDGSITVTKEIDNSLKSDLDQEYSFQLSRLDPDGSQNARKVPVAIGKVTIPANQTTAGSYTVQFYDSNGIMK